ncbi:LANO_0E04456g1_1 [Lachancea nothofagi CBS 11611]|uniref:Biogenesis of lysosome-related organelles complex 1 subunit KXD1 n=1 Tax=Lachancea nothofagi CBS 11611 TaxID=1266666 RepID=A0A1G4JSB9_9SACH|nr:LANO_0E04456g1_1 [Lachancea nothofagi CBS 11611]
MSEVSSSDLGSRSRTASINSQMYAIPDPEDSDSQLSESSSDDEQGSDQPSEDDLELDHIVPETSHTFAMGQLDTPMFDISKYVFQSLSQALNTADFSQAMAVQTRTSGLINSKSRDLKNLADTLQEKLRHFEVRFAQGAQTSRQISKNLSQYASQIEHINQVFQRQYPIEFNQAREDIIERNSSEE